MIPQYFTDFVTCLSIVVCIMTMLLNSSTRTAIQVNLIFQRLDVYLSMIDYPAEEIFVVKYVHKQSHVLAAALMQLVPSFSDMIANLFYSMIQYILNYEIWSEGNYTRYHKNIRRLYKIVYSDSLNIALKIIYLSKLSKY